MIGKRRRTWLVSIAVIIAAVGTLGALAANPWKLQGVSVHAGEDQTNRGFGGSNRDLTRKLSVDVIALGQLQPPRRLDQYRGTLQPSKEVDLAFRRTGKISRIDVDAGQAVRRGQVLASLDVRDLEAVIEGTRARIAEAEAVLDELIAGPRPFQIAAAEAEVERLRATVKLAQVTTNRESELRRANASSVQAYDNARFGVQRQEAALEAAVQQLAELRSGTRQEKLTAQRSRVAVLRSELKGYEIDLQDATIEAPFDGVVSKRWIDEGTVVDPTAVVLRVIQVAPLEARFGISAEDARWLTVGENVHLTVGGQSIDGTVGRIEPELDLMTRTQALFVLIPRSQPNSQSAGDGLVPGRTASLSITVGRSEDSDTSAFWVPIAALARSTRGLWSVMVVSESPGDAAIVQRREVQVLETDTELAKISGGMIAHGDFVVAAGLHRITPGMEVQPVTVEGSTLAENTQKKRSAEEGTRETPDVESQVTRDAVAEQSGRDADAVDNGNRREQISVRRP
jgi:RND family efflux transporter MFP subunit